MHTFDFSSHKPIPYSRFLSLCEQFRTSCETSYGQPLGVNVAVMNCADPFGYRRHEIRTDSSPSSPILEGDYIGIVTSRIWEKGGYVKINFLTSPSADEISRSFASVSFPGFSHHKAHFQVSQDREFIEKEMILREGKIREFARTDPTSRNLFGHITDWLMARPRYTPNA